MMVGGPSWQCEWIVDPGELQRWDLKPDSFPRVRPGGVQELTTQASGWGQGSVSCHKGKEQRA